MPPQEQGVVTPAPKALGDEPGGVALAVEALETDGGEISSTPDPQLIILGCLLTLALLTVAYFAGEIILPLILAIVLKLLLQPAMRALERLRVPRALAAILLVAVLVGAIVGIGAAVSGPAASWAGRLPEGLPRLEQRLHVLARPIHTLQSFLKGVGGGQASIVGEVSSSLFSGTRNVVGGLFEMMLILVFLLASGDTFLRRLVEILPSFGGKRRVVAAFQQIEQDISAYLLTITCMNLAVGAATGLVMWATGLGDPVLWGVVALLLNFVPIMGPFAGVALFVFVGLLTMKAFWMAFVPAALYLLIHIIEGEVVTPMILARRFTLNPVLVVISLIFWFWMWGAPGAVIAIPLLAIFKIACDGVKPLNALAHFIEGE